MAKRETAEPGERCVMCNRPATTYYPPNCDEGEPSCGRFECEYQQQAAMDFHEECGNR